VALHAVDGGDDAVVEQYELESRPDGSGLEDVVMTS
jgi:hypothetical protein